MANSIALKAAYALVFMSCIILPLSAHADSAPPVRAMTENPCLPAIEAPRVLSEAGDVTLNPNVPQAKLLELFANPDVQAYIKAQHDRAQGDWANLCRYREANRTLPSPIRVVFMGDSITENWAKVDPDLFTNGIVGRGISGQTSSQMLLRFFQDVIDLHPQVVHIMAGTNDVAGNTGPTTEKDFQNNLRAMVELAQAHHIRVALASIPPASAFPWQPALRPAQSIQRLNAWLQQYARETHSRYIDYYAALNDGQGGLKPNLSNDGVHPNRDGYIAMRKLAMEGLATAPISRATVGQ
jgi:lysophospholipase L1-like esterase